MLSRIALFGTDDPSARIGESSEADDLARVPEPVDLFMNVSGHRATCPDGTSFSSSPSGFTDEADCSASSNFRMAWFLPNRNSLVLPGPAGLDQVTQECCAVTVLACPEFAVARQIRVIRLPGEAFILCGEFQLTNPHFDCVSNQFMTVDHLGILLRRVGLSLW